MRRLVGAVAAAMLLPNAAFASPAGDQLAELLYAGTAGENRALYDEQCAMFNMDACFGLGLIDLIGAVEGLSQALYRHGAVSPRVPAAAMTLLGRRSSHDRAARRQRLLLRACDQSLADGQLAGGLARPADRFRLLAAPPLGRLLIGAARLHLAENPFPLHLLLEHPQCLVDIVFAYDDLQCSSFFRSLEIRRRRRCGKPARSPSTRIR